VQSQNLDIISSQILEKGFKLYRNEMASWISTDSLTQSEKSKIKGYFTYLESKSKKLISVYVDSTEQLAVKRFSFEQASNLEISLIRVEKNIALTGEEKQILTVRNNAFEIAKFWYQSFGYFEIVNPNIIIYETEPEYVVYIIPGPFNNNIVPIGGDIYLTYSREGKSKKMEPIHNNIIPFNYQILQETIDTGHEHRGKKLGKEFITPTDICTLLLYKDVFNGEKHTVIHKKYISEFYFKDPKLVIRPNNEKLRIK